MKLCVRSLEIAVFSHDITVTNILLNFITSTSQRGTSLCSVLIESCFTSVILCLCVFVLICVRGQTKWGNRTASWPLKWWRTWWRTQSLTSMNWSSGTRVFWRTVPPAGSTWTSSSSSMWRLDSSDSLSADGLHAYRTLSTFTIVCMWFQHSQSRHTRARTSEQIWLEFSKAEHIVGEKIGQYE